MNLHTTQVKIRKCIICGYLFSDEHHVYPRSRGGVRIYVLCPNHHRFANIIQAQMTTKQREEFIRQFAKENFDSGFNQILDELLADYKVEARYQGEIPGPTAEEFFDGVEHEWTEEQLEPVDD